MFKQINNKLSLSTNDNIILSFPDEPHTNTATSLQAILFKVILTYHFVAYCPIFLPFILLNEF